MIVHRFCCLHSRTSQGRGSVRGEPLTGSPTRVQSPARRRPLLRSKSAAPKRKHHPDGWCFLFGAGDEESAEAPPAAEEARRFRGSVLTAGRGSGWEPADTTVSAEEHAKKSPPKWVVIYVITHRFCCSHPRISQGRGSVRGKPLRVSPLAFNHPPAGDRFCAAKSPLQKRRDTHSCVSSFLERATRLELATSTLARSRSTR